MVDASICPICGKPNNCARVRDPNASDCWCSKQKFPKSIFDQIPDDQRRKACICRDCLERALAHENEIE